MWRWLDVPRATELHSILYNRVPLGGSVSVSDDAMLASVGEISSISCAGRMGIGALSSASGSAAHYWLAALILAMLMMKRRLETR